MGIRTYRRQGWAFTFRMWVAGCFLVAFVTCAAEVRGDGADSADKQKIDPDLGLIARVAANMLVNQEYALHPLDDDLSEKLFNEYIDTLDPGKFYLTKEDVAEFAKEKGELDDQLKRGDIDFAFKVYDRLLKRLRDYRDFAKKELKKGFDFTKDESFSIDRKKAERPTNADLKELWRKKLKNDLLTLKLAEKAMKLDATKKGGKASAGASKGEKFAKLWSKPPAERILKRINTLVDSLEKKRPIDRLEFYLASLGQVLDPHSGYMAPSSSEDFDINMKLSLTGIGAVLSTDDNGYTKIVSIIPGGPADRDGRLEKEDRIVAVGQNGGDPVDIVDMPLTNVVHLIRGVRGTRVDLYVVKGFQGAHGVPKVISIVRDKVVLKDQEAKGTIKVLDDHGTKRKVGIINVPSFYIDFQGAASGKPDYTSVTRDVKKILEKFQKEQVDGVVVDMRSNGGGSLSEAVKLTGLFIDSGPVVQVRNAYSRTPQVECDTDDTTFYSGPLVVLISRFSASAAEIFAAAIQDYGRGVVVGDVHTHGKGTVQTIYDLKNVLSHFGLKMDPGQLRITIAKFYRINGDSTQRKGVSPDIVLPDITDALNDLGESSLKTALPWDAIDATDYLAFDELKSYMPTLKEKSQKRVDGNQKFVELKSLIKHLKEINTRKELPLNEKTRWALMMSDKKAIEKQDKILERTTSSKTQEVKDDDIILGEALNIMLDLIDLENSAKKGKAGGAKEGKPAA